jgi:hypothetical protein
MKTIETEAEVSADGLLRVDGLAPPWLKPGRWAAVLVVEDSAVIHGPVPAQPATPFRVGLRSLGPLQEEWGSMSVKEVDAALEAAAFACPQDKSRPA